MGLRRLAGAGALTWLFGGGFILFVIIFILLGMSNC